MKYLHNLLIALDQLLNTLLWGNPDETISSRLGKARRRGNRVAGVLCAVIDFVDRDHCRTAIEEDE